jgi:hypothetical protein
MIPYQFPAGESAAEVIARLRAARWRGQIIGPHGSGKSTLLAALVPELSQQAGGVVVARLQADARELPRCIDEALEYNAPAVPRRLLVIDGYEQLSRWSRLWLQRRCRCVGHGLLVSAHRPLLALRVVYRTQVDPDMAWRVVRHLLRGEACPFTPEDLAGRLAAKGGNLRELLFDLYDRYEARR